MIETNTIIHGDCLTVLRTWPDAFVQCIVTSPPYWGLRDYGVEGQLGLEKSPEEYTAKMVEVFRECRRVLKADGTLWLNLGDSYWGSLKGSGGTGDLSAKQNSNSGANYAVTGTRIIWNEHESLKPKDLCGIPWRVAFALQQPYYTGRIKREADRIWLAAMIDGEGCMFIHKRKAGQSNGQGYFRQNDSFGAGLEVANTHRSIIERCLEITGCGSICTVERETKFKKRNIPLHRWNLRSNECRNIVREVYPYLVGKKHEARILLGCPSSGERAIAAHAAMILLHNGGLTDVDFPAPASMFEQGFYLRSDVIWSKNNPMPESVTDRPTKSHEYVFLMSKSERYYYNADAIAESVSPSTKVRISSGPVQAIGRGAKQVTLGNNHGGPEYFGDSNRNKRTVWTVPTSPFPEAHFATFPPDLIKPMVLAGSRPGDIVLDPFMGAGTVALVAKELNRRYIGIELNADYIKIAQRRLRQEVLDFAPRDVEPTQETMGLPIQGGMAGDLEHRRSHDQAGV